VHTHRRSQDLQRGGPFVKNSRFSRSILKKNSGERKYTVNFKDLFPKGGSFAPPNPLAYAYDTDKSFLELIMCIQAER
jgi:hypothetical protein